MDIICIMKFHGIIIVSTENKLALVKILQFHNIYLNYSSTYKIDKT